MSKIIIDFSKLRDAELDQKAQTILTEMAVQAAVFTDPVPSLTVLETALEDYRIAMAAAADRGLHAVEVKRQKRKVLETTLRQLGWYVLQVAHDDRAVLLSSGYRVRKEKTSAGILPRPAGFMVRCEEVGRVLMRVKTHRNTRSYNFQYRKAGNEVWIEVNSTRSSIVIDGLESGARYQFRAAYIGANPTRTFSDVLESYVL